MYTRMRNNSYYSSKLSLHLYLYVFYINVKWYKNGVLGHELSLKLVRLNPPS